MEQKRIVIIGAGIVGCSTAYFLNQMGQYDVTVIEQGPLFETGGSTSHAPGLVAQLNFSKLMTELAADTVATLNEVSDPESPSFYTVGSLEVAKTPERLADIKRKASVGKSWGIEAHVLNPEQCKERCKFINPDEILGGLYTPTDGIAKPLRAIKLMTDYSKSKGTKFYGHTEVTGITVIDGEVKGVETDNGDFEADLVISCAGFWGPKIGEMVDVAIPLQPIAHQYLFSNDIPELADETEEVTAPLVRDQDSSMYYRQIFNGVGIGSYQHEALPVEVDEIAKYDENEEMPSIKPFTPEHFYGKPSEDAKKLIPGLKEAGIERGFNGIFSFTPDGMPILGESNKVRGFWAAEAVWVTHSAGVARQIAEWIVNGAPSLDLELCDINRFDDYAQSPAYYKARSKEDYETVYDIHHPNESPATARKMRVSPFYMRQEALDAVFNESLGFEQPQWYKANEALTETYANRILHREGWEAQYWSPIIEAEQLHLQEHAGLYDLTASKQRLEISGKGALEFLQSLTTGDIDITIGTKTKTLMLQKLAGIKDEITVIRKADDAFFVLCTGPAEANWIRKHQPQSGVTIQDVTAGTCGVGIIGNSAREILESIDRAEFTRDSWEIDEVKELYIKGAPALVTYSPVNDLNTWEIYTTSDLGLHLWDTIYQAGQIYNLIAIGDRAMENLRIEAHVLRNGKDFWSEHTPFDIKLNDMVDLTKEFIGKEALIERTKTRPKLVAATLILDAPNRVVMGHEPVIKDEKPAGYVTSAGYSYSLGRGIVHALVDPVLLGNDNNVVIEYFDELLPATVLDKTKVIL